MAVLYSFLYFGSVANKTAGFGDLASQVHFAHLVSKVESRNRRYGPGHFLLTPPPPSGGDTASTEQPANFCLTLRFSSLSLSLSCMEMVCATVRRVGPPSQRALCCAVCEIRLNLNISSHAWKRMVTCLSIAQRLKYQTSLATLLNSISSASG